MKTRDIEGEVKSFTGKRNEGGEQTEALKCVIFCYSCGGFVLSHEELCAINGITSNFFLTSLQSHSLPGFL